MALNHVTLDDKYDLSKSRIFVTGFQALVRLCLMQKERDRRAGLNTAGYVTGYRGSNAARHALETGEINYYSESPPSYRALVEPNLVKNGVAVGLFYDSGWDGRNFNKPLQVEGLDMLPYHELYKKITGKMPSGHLWETYKTIVSLSHAMQRMAVFPPGAPKAAIDAMTAGFKGLETDAEFAAEGRKTFGFVPAFRTGPDTNAKIRGALTVTPETKAFIAKYVADARLIK